MNARRTAILVWLVLTAAVAVLAQEDLPPPGDPSRLVDLRWLARPLPGPLLLTDTFATPGTPAKVGTDFLLVAADGPGVLQHLMVTPKGRLRIRVDGQVVWEGVPGDAWPAVYPAPPANRRGAPPWVFPLVQTAWGVSHLILPISFRERLEILADSASRPAWAAVYRLPAPARLTVDDPAFRTAAGAVAAALAEPTWPELAVRGCRVLPVSAYCAPGGRTELPALEGAGEIVAWRFEVTPTAMDLLRHLVLEICPDGLAAPLVRMPLVDFLGVSHPWPQGWAPLAGDLVAGVVQPYVPDSTGQWRDRAVVFSRLPVPFAQGLRWVVWNRSADYPVTLSGKVAVAPLSAAAARTAGRLCGTSRRVSLPRPVGEVELLSLPTAGTLVGLSLFTTGHRTLYTGQHPWREQDRWRLDETGEPCRFSGPGLLPFAQWSNSPMFGGATWNQNSVFPAGLIGAGRHFWVDPLPLAGASAVTYVCRGENGPTRAETAALWYALPAAAGAPVAYRAPPQPADVEPVPAPAGPVRKQAPADGWAAEAEDLVPFARTAEGPVEARGAGAADTLPFGGAYLTWNADGPGAVLDLPVLTPVSRYVGFWRARVLFPAGAVFQATLVAADEPRHPPRWRQDDEGYRGRVLGQAQGPSTLDCWNAWPWARRDQDIRHNEPPMLNPNPGGAAWLRFLCVTRHPGSRSHLLALDRIGLEPAPATPAGWREFEDLPVPNGSPDVSVALMNPGRREFHGWGGWTIRTRARAVLRFALGEPLAGPAAAALEIRGAVVTGTWTLIAVGTGKSVDLVGAKPASGGAQDAAAAPVAVWTLPLVPAQPRPLQLAVQLECRTETGEILLDAWQPVASGR